MRRAKTLRVRFALWVACLVVTVLALFGAIMYFSLAQGLYGTIDDSLRLSASQAIATVNIENGQINFSDSVPEGAPATELRDRGLTIRILDPAGYVVQSFGPYRSLPIDTATLAAAQQKRPSFVTVPAALQEDSVRFYTAPIVESGQLAGIVQVGQSLGEVQDTLYRLLATLLVGGPILALLAALGSYFLTARALAPIDDVTRTAQRISAENLSARLNLPPTDDEVGRLAATFDGMLARLDDAFRRERQFTADASHELRTPLAAMQAILSVTREGQRSSAEYQQALADLADEADRLRTLVENLLLLARGDTQARLVHETVQVSTLLYDVTDSLRPLAAAKGLALICAAPAGLTLHGDIDALIRLLVNLVDNAVRYTTQGTIMVAAVSEAGAIVITVSDTGIGIPAEHLPRIFDRFYRVDAARTTREGGLGLAIALDIVHAHGGTLEVSSQEGQGTTFTARLPRSGALLPGKPVQ